MIVSIVKTAHVIYGVFCEKCDKVMYVGETGTSVYERMANHISTIKNEKDDNIPDHFTSNGHSVKDFRWFGIEKIRKNDIHMRKIRESFWIRKAGTLIPIGLNKNGGIGDQDRGVL